MAILYNRIAIAIWKSKNVLSKPFFIVFLQVPVYLLTVVFSQTMIFLLFQAVFNTCPLIKRFDGVWGDNLGGDTHLYVLFQSQILEEISNTIPEQQQAMLWLKELVLLVYILEHSDSF